MTYSIKRYKKNMQTDSTKMRLTQSSFGNNWDFLDRKKEKKV